MPLDFTPRDEDFEFTIPEWPFPMGTFVEPKGILGRTTLDAIQGILHFIPQITIHDRWCALAQHAWVTTSNPIPGEKVGLPYAWVQDAGCVVCGLTASRQKDLRQRTAQCFNVPACRETIEASVAILNGRTKPPWGVIDRLLEKRAMHQAWIARLKLEGKYTPWQDYVGSL